MKKNNCFIKYWYLIVLIVFMDSLLACQNEAKPKIGFLIPNLVAGRYQKEKVYFKNRINELGGQAIVSSANYDDKLQIKQADNLISEGVKILVVNPVDFYTSAQIVRSAHQKGIKVIAYDRLICNSDLDYYISFDSEKVGELMARYATKKIPAGNYLIFGGDMTDRNAVLVKEGEMKILEPYISSGKIKIGYDIYVEDWSEENAKHALKRYLNLSDSHPDVILSAYDGMSEGIITTLKEFGLEGKVIVTGQDAELNACRNIVQGIQSMTVYKPFKKMAYMAAELSMKLIRSQKLDETTSKIFNGSKNVPSILLQPTAVDKSNLKSTVIADSFYTKSDIYQQTN